ncbi:MAG: LysE family transporter [Sedimentisphaerales bacterium]|nr:LysE family transporter [Sedimentisphaerales bacterium]
MALMLFLVKAVVISLSGVMSPGAVTAAAIARGARNRWAGPLMALGHGIVEIPLIFLIMLGLGVLFQMTWFKIAVGCLGGAFLIWMGVGMWREAGKAEASPSKEVAGGPLMTGVVLSIGNPLFLVWWATVGLNLTIEARSLGWIAFLLFALVHWLCDLVWLTVLSFAAFHGTNVFGPRVQKVVLHVCSAAVIVFGIHFAYQAILLLYATWRPA